MADETDDLPEVTDADVEAIEELVGYMNGAWDMVAPEDIIRAALRHYRVGELQQKPALGPFHCSEHGNVDPECRQCFKNVSAKVTTLSRRVEELQQENDRLRRLRSAAGNY